MADCSYWEYQISLALDDELGTDGKDGLTRHLAGCAHCRDVRDGFAKSAQTLRVLPDLAGPDLLAGIEHDILAKTCRAKGKPARPAWPAVAAGLLTVFAAANIWLGPLWQRPALLTAAVAPGNHLELTFNQPMNGSSWPGTAAWQENTRGSVKAGSAAPAAPSTGTPDYAAGPRNAPQAGGSSSARPAPAGPTDVGTPPARITEAPAQKATAAPPYTVSRQGNRLVVSFAGPLPQGPVQILVPATVRDLWGRQLGRAYLVMIDRGKITVKTP